MFDGFLQIEDGAVKGESQESNHKDWIEVLSYSHHVTQPTSSTRSSAGGATTGASEHGDILVSKFIDLSSPKLHEAASTGKHFKKATIDFLRQSGDAKVKYLTINLEDLVISQVSTNGAAGSNELPTETIGLNYGKIEWIYTQQKRADGSPGGNTRASYDLKTAKA